MYCEKCGTKLEDSASFCTKCGASIKGEVVKTKEKVEDKEVQLNVKPTYKIGYMVLPYLFTYAIFAVCLGFPLLVSGLFSAITVFGAIFIVVALLFGISYIFTKKQYDNYSYDLYKTKVIYRDSFLNVSEKEVKYKYIREVTMRQTIIQRIFNIGNIVLFTNAETGVGNGICIVNVQNVQEIYKKIKSTIDV